MDDAWYCGDCKEHQEATKKLELWKTPDVCVVQLKRFQVAGDYREKIEILVNFPINGFDLRQWFTEGSPHGGDHAIYDLYAVSNHFGGLGGIDIYIYIYIPVYIYRYIYNPVVGEGGCAL